MECARICPFWSVNKTECALFEKCAWFGICFFWNVLKMCLKQNLLVFFFFECTLFWKCLRWNGSKLNPLSFEYTQKTKWIVLLLWNVLFLELAVVESGMNTTRNVAFGKTEWALLDCALLVIRSFWNILFLECALFEMCWKWNDP